MILFDIKLLVIALAALVLLFLLARYRYKVAIPLTAALLIATHWSYYFRYEYNGSNIFLLDRINIYPLILWTSERMRWSINSAEELKTKLDELSITMVRHLMNGKTVFYLQRMSLEPCKKKRKSKYPSSNGVFPRWKQEARVDAVS